MKLSLSYKFVLMYIISIYFEWNVLKLALLRTSIYFIILVITSITKCPIVCYTQIHLTCKHLPQDPIHFLANYSKLHYQRIYYAHFEILIDNILLLESSFVVLICWLHRQWIVSWRKLLKNFGMNIWSLAHKYV